MKSACRFAVLLVVLPAGLVLAQDAFTPEHVAKLRAVTAAAISPDGSKVAYVLDVPRQPFKDKDGPSWGELHVVGADGVSRPYVSGQVNIGGVAWTPDGKGISFLSKRGDDKNRSLYVIPADGGEARQVLEHDTDIASYDWSPDGKQVAYLAHAAQSKKLKEQKDKGFTQEIYEEDEPATRIWIATPSVLPAHGSPTHPQAGEKPRLIDVPGSASLVRWSPKGTQLAAALAPTPLVDDDLMNRKIRIIDVATGKITAELDNPGKIGPLAWSPDGVHVALVSAADRNDPREGRIWVAAAKGGPWRDLTPNYPGHVQDIAWKDNQTVLYAGHEGVWSTLADVTLDGKKRTWLPADGPILHGFNLSRDGKSVAFVADAPNHPRELFLFRLDENKPRRLTTSNPWLEKMRFASQEVVKHKAKDGLDLEGILVRPLDEKKGMKYPLILAVHGGPEAHVANAWVTSYGNPGQFAAARGFAVFYPNYRGSTGRGVEFSKLGQRDAAGKEFDDLVDAVDHLVKIGLVDTNKVGVTGGSYGGYASAWCATYYTKRFAASVMFVGLSDNISMYGTTDIPYEMNLVHHRKWLWEDFDYFKKSSPIMYVEQARTPLLIMHGKADPRVPPSQSFELHRHLKVLGQTPVRLVLYPGEGHGNRRAASRYDYSLRMMQWFEHYLKGPGGKPPDYELEYPLLKKE